MADTKLRDLERAWKAAGTDAAAEAYLQAKIRGGDMPVRLVLELALGQAIGRSPTASDMIAYLDTALLPCSRPDCENRAMTVAQFEPSQVRICLAHYVAEATAIEERRRATGSAFVDFVNDELPARSQVAGFTDVGPPDPDRRNTVPASPPEPVLRGASFGDWVTDPTLPPEELRTCANEDCVILLLPGHEAIYCSTRCAEGGA